MAGNKKMGSDFEKELCIIASKKGFWAHRLNENVNGQPADLILCKNNTPALIDCKVCEGNKFLLSRIEENQELAMRKWLNLGNRHALFAIKIENEVWLIPFCVLQHLKEDGLKQLNKDQIIKYGYSFSVWEGMLHEN